MANVRRSNTDPMVIQRKKRRNRALIATFFLFIGAVVLLESPLTRVRVFQVTGNTSIPASKILKSAKLHKGMSLWQVNGAAVSANVSRENTLVQSVTVHTDLLSGIVTLQVSEKHVVALYEANGTFYRVLDDGDIYGTVTPADGFAWPIVTTSRQVKVTDGQAIPTTGWSALMRQLGKTSPVFLANVSQVELDTYGLVTLYFSDGFAARCQATQLTGKVPAIQSAVAYFTGKGARPGLIDVSTGPPYEYTPFAKTKAKLPSTAKTPGQTSKSGTTG